jgi:molybdenum cofactor biosynthesis enzyme MoaA
MTSSRPLSAMRQQHTTAHGRGTDSSKRRFDFANILFGGPCNQRCPYCIAKQLPAALTRNNLDEFPPQNLNAYVALIQQHDIRQITLTGTSTDPQLYRHEARLLRCLRTQLPEAQISLHTNGQLAVRKMHVFNMYDRATVSLPSFDPSTFASMAGTPHMPDLAAILSVTKIPVKVSCVIDEQNAEQIDEFVARCHSMGVRRLALRQLYGDRRQWQVLPDLEPVTRFGNNPVYDYHGMQVTYWRFERTTTTALNLFPDGTIGTEYLLAKTA